VAAQAKPPAVVSARLVSIGAQAEILNYLRRFSSTAFSSPARCRQNPLRRAVRGRESVLPETRADALSAWFALECLFLFEANSLGQENA